jgi:hypothetical protein
MGEIRTGLVVALLLASAGCSALVYDETSTEDPTTPTEQTPSGPTSTQPTTDGLSDVRVVGEPLPVDEDIIFQRVQELLDEDLRVPQVTVQSSSDPTLHYELPRYTQLLGIEYPDNISEQPNVSGSTENGRSILITLNENATTDEIIWTLAHEYAHLPQFQNGVIGDGPSSKLPLTNRYEEDQFLTRRSITEGAATYTANVYAEKYNLEESASPVVKQNFSALPSWRQYVLAPYIFGSNYVRSRINSPKNIDQIYENPPQTTEQLLHPGVRDEPTELNPSAVISVPGWNSTERYRMGELYIRIVLDSELSSERATSAAGWGNDSLTVYEREGAKDSYAWMLRWDDAANATEFEQALRTYLDSRADTDGNRWQTNQATYTVKRPDDRTVVLHFGTRDFIDSLA